MNGEGAGSAIEQVLTAEREASAAVERCRQSAESVVHEGLVQSRRILDRADRRITLVHAIADRSIDIGLAGVRGEVASISARPEVDETELHAMERAADRLILALTGGRSEGAP